MLEFSHDFRAIKSWQLTAFKKAETECSWILFSSNTVQSHRSSLTAMDPTPSTTRRLGTMWDLSSSKRRMPKPPTPRTLHRSVMPHGPCLWNHVIIIALPRQIWYCKVAVNILWVGHFRLVFWYGNGLNQTVTVLHSPEDFESAKKLWILIFVHSTLFLH